MELSILVTFLAFCLNTGSGNVRICKTAMSSLKTFLDFYPILIIPPLTMRVTLDIGGWGAFSECERGVSLSLLRRYTPSSDKKWDSIRAPFTSCREVVGKHLIFYQNGAVVVYIQKVLPQRL